MVFREYRHFIASFQYTLSKCLYDTFYGVYDSSLLYLGYIFTSGINLFKNRLVNPSWINSFNDVLIFGNNISLL